MQGNGSVAVSPVPHPRFQPENVADDAKLESLSPQLAKNVYNSRDSLRQIIDVLQQVMCTYEAEKLAVAVLEIYEDSYRRKRSSR